MDPNEFTKIILSKLKEINSELIQNGTTILESTNRLMNRIKELEEENAVLKKELSDLKNSQRSFFLN